MTVVSGASDRKRGRVAGVIFDWDGVLLDSLDACYSVYNKIFEKTGTRKLTRNEFLGLQSPNWYDFYSAVGLPARLWKYVDEEWLRLYDQEKPSLYPDAKPCLDSLKGAGLRLALVSNGSEVRVRRELEGFGLGPLFESILCGRKKEELKPSPVMLQKALATMQLEPEDAVYVGDAPADVRASKSAGLESIAISRDRILGERLSAEGPDHLFDGLDEFLKFLMVLG